MFHIFMSLAGPLWFNKFFFFALNYLAYRNDPMFSDRQVRAKHVDPDQGLHCLPFRLHFLNAFH